MISSISLRISSFRQFAIRPLVIQPIQFLYTSPVIEAARKGTREKARKKKVKVEVKKIGFIPHNQRGKDRLNLLRKDRHIDDSIKREPSDNVYVGTYFRWPIYTVADAVECHRQTHHPSMYNEPNAPLNVTIEINMQGEKITRFVDRFQRMVKIKHPFDLKEERNILVFTKGEELVTEAKEAGATLVGGIDIIQSVQKGDLKVDDYQFVIAHPNILPDLVPIRGLMKRKFPNPKNQTLTGNLAESVNKFLTGINYNAVRDEHQLNYGKVETCIGTINMEKAHLESNLEELLKDIYKMRPKRAGKFVTRVLLTSPPSSEILKIDPFLYIPEEYVAPKISEVEEPTNEEPTNEEEEEVEAKN